MRMELARFFRLYPDITGAFLEIKYAGTSPIREMQRSYGAFFRKTSCTPENVVYFFQFQRALQILY
jgi:hypothetical protein